MNKPNDYTGSLPRKADPNNDPESSEFTSCFDDRIMWCEILCPNTRCKVAYLYTLIFLRSSCVGDCVTSLMGFCMQIFQSKQYNYCMSPCVHTKMAMIHRPSLWAVGDLTTWSHDSA